MTDEEIQKAKESFLRMGVAEKSIFSEIMRARYLDYNLFLNPTNAEYGVTIESLYENMKLTSDKFGDYTGNEEAYANVYTLAMRINPMDFATGVTKAGNDLRGLIEFVISQAKQSGKTILFAGADHYIYMLPKIFYDLNDCRIAVAVKSEVWKKNLSNLFPRGRIMLEKEIFHDEELYDYIFFFEKDSLKTLDEVIQEEMPEAKIGVLSGPSHAEEVSIGVPTVLVVASKHEDVLEMVQKDFMSKDLRIYTSKDVKGVELGGALKNIIAFCAGTAAGIGLGDNSFAALITRGLTEISRLGIALGGEKDTFYGLSGLGDLIVTCLSEHSRNRKAGKLIGQGKTLEETKKEVGMTIESIDNIEVAYELAKINNIEMPIVQMVYDVLYNKLDPKKAVQMLMTRDRKSE